jgi:TonB family protein
MLRILLCLFVLLCTFNSSSLAQDCSAFDAFASVASGPPVHVNPALRDFLREKAIMLKQEWQRKGSPNLPSVSAIFDPAMQSWKITAGQGTRTKPVDQESATSLVRAVLRDNPPSISKPCRVRFEFPFKDATTLETAVTTSSNKQPDVDFGPYMTRLQRKIQSNWRLNEAPDRVCESVVEFLVKENGSVSALLLQSSSGNAKYDTAALNAVGDSGAFLPLPKDSSATVAIQFTFNYQPGKPVTNYIIDIDLAQPEVIFCIPTLMGATSSCHYHHSKLSFRSTN